MSVKKPTPIFVGGCPRSGTTLLGALLGAHSRCVCLPEAQFHLDILLRTEPENPIAKSELVELLEERWQFRLWEISARSALEELEENRLEPRAVMEAMAKRYAAAVEKSEADRWIDHTPGNARHGFRILERFPQARLIHLVRDGRGVTASIASTNWGPSTIEKMGRIWPEWLGFGFALELRYPERVMRVRYEDLVREPVATLAELCRFVEVDMEPQMGRKTDFRVPKMNENIHALVSRPPDPARASAWKESLSRREIEIFESFAGSLLASLDYELMFGGQARPPTFKERSWHRIQALGMAPLRRLRHTSRIRRTVRPSEHFSRRSAAT